MQKIWAAVTVPILSLGAVVGLGVVTASPAVASVPITVTATVESESVTISWNDPDLAASRYAVVVYFADSIFSADVALVEETGSNGGSYAFTSGNAGQAYYAEVVSYQGPPGEDVLLNNGVSANFTFIENPSQIQNLNAYVEGTSIVASWDAPESAGGDNPALLAYTANLRELDTSNIISSYSGVDRFYTFADVPPGSYYVEVYALNSFNGAGPAVSYYGLEVVNNDVAPSNPVIISASSVGRTGYIEWNPVANADSFELTILDEAEEIVYSETITDGNATITSVANLPANSTLLVYLSASNEFGTSGLGAATLIVGDNIAPNSPTDVVAEKVDNDFRVTWGEPEVNGGPAPTLYYVTFYDYTNGGEITTVTIEDLEYTFTDVSFLPGNAYKAFVSAENEFGISGAQNSNIVTIDPVSPDAVRNFEARLTAPTSTLLTWQAPSYTGGAPIVKYILTYTIAGEDPVEVQLPADRFSAAASGWPEFTEIDFTVTAVNSAGGTISDTLTLTTGPANAPSAPPVPDVDGFTPPEEVVVDFGKQFQNTIPSVINLPEGSWVYGFVYSTPMSLGWAQVPANGVVNWDFGSLELAPGAHRLVILNSNGDIIGVQGFTVAATDNSGSLPNTGLNSNVQPAAYGAVVALMMGIMMVVGSTVVRRQSVAKAVVKS